MKIKTFLLALLLLPVLILEAQKTEPELVAESFLTNISKGKPKKAYKLFSDTVQNLMGQEVFLNMIEGITESKGNISSFKGTGQQLYKDWVLLLYAVEFTEDKPITMRIVVDLEVNRVSGMFFVPNGGKISYMEPVEYGLELSYREKRMELNSNTTSLSSILTLPMDSKRHPVVIFLHGSGPNDMDGSIGPNKVFYDLTLGLVEKGIGTFRFNKRTFEASESFTDTSTIYSEYLEDCLNAIKMLKEIENVDTNRIFVLGHSQGATMIYKLAQMDPSIAGVISMAGNCNNMLSLIPNQFRYLKENTSQQITDSMITHIEKSCELALNGKLNSSTPKSMLPLGASAAYWNSVIDNNHSDIAKTLELPILILQGERDYQVDTNEYRCWKETLSGKENVHSYLFPGLNHLFVYGKDKSVPDEYQMPGNVAVDVINYLVGWIEEN
jgi:dienelactone hydrolase